MEPYSLPESIHYDTTIFNGNSAIVAGSNWLQWSKPIGKSQATIIVIGAGGGGGLGAIGAVSNAAGGGGGGSGGMTIVDIPLNQLPAKLFISVGSPKIGNGLASYVATAPNIISGLQTVAMANGGGTGGTATGATAGTAGPSGSIALAANMVIGWPYARLALAGQVGVAGGTTVSAASLPLPLTGLRVTSGGGGSGLPASGNGLTGGSFTTPASPSYFLPHLGGAAPTLATQPANPGNAGFAISDAGFYYYGGTGGSSTFTAATGLGLSQAAGGNGGIGSGGGGAGGALTGSTPAAASYGGAGLVIITCY
jgi:hypothetical protein